MAFAGLRGTGDWGTDERPKNFREMILWRNPNGTAPLTAMLARAASEAVNDPEFNWWEEEQNVVRLRINGALSDSDTAFVVDAGALNLVKGDLLMVEKLTETTAFDEEVVFVDAVASDTAWTAVRGAAGTTAATIADDLYLTKIGNVFGEGTLSPTVSARNPTKLLNKCQIFKTAYELTETAKKTRSRTGDPLANDKKRRMFDHSTAMEFAFLFGRVFEDTDPVNGKPRRFTGGLREFLTSNVTIFGVSPTEDNVIDAITPVFDYDVPGAGDQRIAFCGNGFLTSLNKLVRNSASTRFNFDKVLKVYGMSLQQLILPQGTIGFRTHPLMNVHPLYTNSAFLVHGAGMKYRYVRDTQPQDHIEANDADTHKGQWLTECGLEVHHEKTMAYLGNLNL